MGVDRMINDITKLKIFLKIMEELYDKQQSGGKGMMRKELIEKLKINQPTMSQYISEMKDMGFIDELTRKNEKLYVLLPTGIRFFRDFGPLIPRLNKLEKAIEISKTNENVKEILSFNADLVIDRLKKINVHIDDKKKKKLRFYDDYGFDDEVLKKKITFMIIRCIDDKFSFANNFVKKIEDLINTSASYHKEFKGTRIEGKVETYPEDLTSPFKIILEKVPSYISIENVLKNGMNLEDFEIEREGSKIYLTFKSPLSVIVDALSDYNPELEVKKGIMTGKITLSKEVEG